MKKFKVIIMLFSLSIVHLFAIENKKDFFEKGDVIKVDFCDKYQWCKLSDGSGYIKEFYFIKDKNDPYILKQNYTGITYLYQLIGTQDQEISLEKFIDANKIEDSESNMRTNYKYGYIRKVDLQGYMKDYELVQEKETQILVKKEEPKVIEKVQESAQVVSLPVEIEKEIKVEKQQKYFTYFDMGVAKFSSNHPDSIDMMLDIGLGYNLDNQNNITFGYMGNIENSQDQLRGVELNNIYLGYNYNFLGEYNPSLGIIAGYSAMKVYLDKESGNSIDEEQNKKIFYGIQSSINKKITPNLSWEIKLSYLQLDLKTPSVNVTNSLNLFGGFIYKFD